MTGKLSPLATLVLTLTIAGAAHAQVAASAGLHDALHLTAPQEDAWRAYRAATEPDPYVQAQQRATQAMLPTLKTPRRIDLINAQMEADLDSVRKRGEAVKAFYAALTPEQQRTFDRQTAPRPTTRPDESGPSPD